MNSQGHREPLFSAVRLRGDFFPWVLALATGLDYFDNAIFSFFASYIAGNINASPEEMVWSSSTYAVTAVLGILQQQWWVERVGSRRYVSGCLLLYALGSSVAALSAISVTQSCCHTRNGSSCRVSRSPRSRPRG